MIADRWVRILRGYTISWFLSGGWLSVKVSNPL
jgi:hypothetical protein